MTLIKSLLLGSAAGIVAIASAQAADLPTKKGAPAAEYVKVCSITVNGSPIVGFTLPGSDTCLKISGYVSAQYTYAPARTTTQNAVGLFSRGQVNFDAVSNTAMGPLLAHVEVQEDYGDGFDSRYGGYGAGNARTQLNNGYVQWAGLTAGKHASFYDFIGGSINTWDDIISPDHTGTPTEVLAYTASFGGGFAATVSLEAPQGTGTANAPLAGAYTAGGNRSPDIVGALTVSQGWGGAQLSAVAHNSRGATLGPAVSQDVWGYGFLGGLKFNIPGMAGADVKLQGVYAYDAPAYGGGNGVGDFNLAGQAGEGGLPLFGADYIVGGAAGTTVYNSTTWSIAGGADLPVSPTFKISPEASYGSTSYGGWGSETAFLGGGTFEWTPVKNLVFDLDLLYLTGTYKEPGAAVPIASTNFNGFNAKLRIERDF